MGTSANAVHIQIWTALIAILLLKYLQMRSRLGWSLSNLIALLRLNLFVHRDLWAWLDHPYEPPPETLVATSLPSPSLNLDSMRNDHPQNFLGGTSSKQRSARPPTPSRSTTPLQNQVILDSSAVRRKTAM